MPDNDTTGGYVLHMAVSNTISYSVGNHLHHSSIRVWIWSGNRHRSGQDACGRFYTLYPACAFRLGSGMAGNSQDQIDGRLKNGINRKNGRAFYHQNKRRAPSQEPSITIWLLKLYAASFHTLLRTIRCYAAQAISYPASTFKYRSPLPQEAFLCLKKDS